MYIIYSLSFLLYSGHILRITGGSIKQRGSEEKTCPASSVMETTQTTTHLQQLPGEDLRAYAYEGDGSSSGSLTSTISGLVRPALPP